MTLSRTPYTLFLLMLSPWLLLPLPSPAQTPDASAAMSTSGYLATPSNVLSPALGSLRQALKILRPERWKASSAITSESASDINSIERDLDTTLPPLLSDADAAAGSTAQLLPAYRNVEALYDVLVRVTQTAVLAAPAQQSEALQQATAALQQGRSSFGTLLNQAAQAQDRQLHQAQTSLHTLQAAAAQPAPVCPPVVKKPRPHAKPKPKPAATSKAPAAQ